MALRSAVHALISRSQADTERGQKRDIRGLLWAGFLTLAVAGPWLLPGYLFGTDWPGSRHFPLPTTLVSSAPLNVVLAVVAWAVGGEATGKLVVLGFLFSAGALAYKALPEGGFVARATAATLYVVNPFVYSRLHYGQFFLLAAYAALPWALLATRRLLVEPRLRSSLGAAAAFVLLGICSPHVLLMGGLLAAVLYVAQLVATKERLSYLRQSGPWAVVAVVVATVVSSYWLIPLITGHGAEGAVVTGTGPGELTAYAAVPDRSLGLLTNLLGLYGFWAENSGRFTSMKAFVPGWPVVLAAILAIGAIGAIAVIRRKAIHLTPWVIGLLVAGTVAVVLEMGVSHPATAGLVRWLDGHFVLYRGMRDAGKWAVVVALVFSQLVGLGAAATLLWLHKWVQKERAEWITAAATGLLLAVPLFYGNGLLFGSHGEIKPSQYPSGWYQADQVLVTDRNPGRTLFLPWHEYMSYSFIQNQNRVVAPPAPSFFSVPVVTSTDPEVPGVVPPSNSVQVAVSGLVRAGAGGQWAIVLADQGVKYILVTHELDWSSYRYLDDQPGIVKVGDFGSIVLYRNSLIA